MARSVGTLGTVAHAADACRSNDTQKLAQIQIRHLLTQSAQWHKDACLPARHQHAAAWTLPFHNMTNLVGHLATGTKRMLGQQMQARNVLARLAEWHKNAWLPADMQRTSPFCKDQSSGTLAGMAQHTVLSHNAESRTIANQNLAGALAQLASPSNDTRKAC